MCVVGGTGAVPQLIWIDFLRINRGGEVHSVEETSFRWPVARCHSRERAGVG